MMSRPFIQRAIASIVYGVLVATTPGVIVDAASAQAEPYRVRASVTPCLNVRTAPERDAGRTGCLLPATRIEVIGSAPYWRRIRTAEGTTGWVAKKFIEPEVTAQDEEMPVALPADLFLEIHVVDVGQGDGIWIHTPDDGIDGNGRFEGRNIVIDGGPNAADGTNEMLRYLRRFAHHDASIDALIVTHPHDDHFPGAEGILRHFEVRRYYDPGYDKRGVAYPAFKAAVLQERADGVPSRVMFGREQFEPLDWGRELQAEILYSDPGSVSGLGSGSTRENNASIVLRLEYGQHSFLFMGDAEGKNRRDSPNRPKYVEKILLETTPPEKLRATVLKLAHHGSETSSTLPFMAAVAPEAILVSSGRRPYSGRFLPDASVLERYCERSDRVRIYRTDHEDEAEGRTGQTDQDGDHIVVRTNGRDLQITQFSSGREVQPQSCGAPE